MSINGIGRTESVFGDFGVSGRKSGPASAPESALRRGDSISFSPEALALAYGAEGADDSLMTGNALEYKLPVTSENEAAKALDLKSSRFLTMLLENIFMESLSESGSLGGNPNPDSGEVRPEVSKGLGEQSGGSAAKVMDDFIQGKVDISDLPEMMASGGKGGAAGGKHAKSTDEKM